MVLTDGGLDNKCQKPSVAMPPPPPPPFYFIVLYDKDKSFSGTESGESILVVYTNSRDYTSPQLFWAFMRGFVCFETTNRITDASAI